MNKLCSVAQMDRAPGFLGVVCLVNLLYRPGGRGFKSRHCNLFRVLRGGGIE